MPFDRAIQDSDDESFVDELDLVQDASMRDDNQRPFPGKHTANFDPSIASYEVLGVKGIVDGHRGNRVDSETHLVNSDACFPSNSSGIGSIGRQPSSPRVASGFIELIGLNNIRSCDDRD